MITLEPIDPFLRKLKTGAGDRAAPCWLRPPGGVRRASARSVAASSRSVPASCRCPGPACPRRAARPSSAPSSGEKTGRPTPCRRSKPPALAFAGIRRTVEGWLTRSSVRGDSFVHARADRDRRGVRCWTRRSRIFATAWSTSRSPAGASMTRPCSPRCARCRARRSCRTTCAATPTRTRRCRSAPARPSRSRTSSR